MTAVYSCVRSAVGSSGGITAARLPVHVRTVVKRKQSTTPLYRLLHDEPNPEMTSFVFRETLMTHLLLWGNAYAQVIRNGKGRGHCSVPAYAEPNDG